MCPFDYHISIPSRFFHASPNCAAIHRLEDKGDYPGVYLVTLQHFLHYRHVSKLAIEIIGQQLDPPVRDAGYEPSL